MSVHSIRTERMQPGDVYIGRFSPWRPISPVTPDTPGYDGYFGNPHRVDHESQREGAIAAFERDARERIDRDAAYRDRVRALFGKRLYCWCAPLACHGDVLEKLSCELHDAERMEREGGA